MKLAKDRLELIKRHIAGKSVLDLGCVDHEAAKEQEHFWLHRFLKENSKYVLGVDANEKEVAALKEKGYEMVSCNVENLDLRKRFDVVVAGELIEHLSNPGMFLNNARRHMKDDGRLIITTPNAFAARRIIRLKLGLKIQSNAEHVAWYDHDTLKALLHRHGFKIAEFSYFLDPFHSKIKFWFEYIVAKIWKRMAPYMIVVAEKNE